MILPKVQLIKFDTNKITDHNRSGLEVQPEKIGNSQRMANGTMRRYFVVEKNKFTCTWDNLPGLTTRTIDGFWGANSLENHYLTVPGAFTLTITFADGHTSTYTVMWDSFSKTLEKRGVDDLYSVSMTLVEV